MKTIVVAGAVCVVTGLVLLTNLDQSSAQNYEPGPGPGGSVLRDPFAPPTAPAQTSPGSAPGTQPFSVESMFTKTPAGDNPALNPLASKLAALAPSKISTLNDDIKITPAHGPFVIFIQNYSGEECHKLARQLVGELRSAYKLNAFTFNKGAEEKRKEYERVMELIEKQKERYQKNGVSTDVPIRVGFMHIEEQCAVILGGYASEDAARRALKGVRELKPLDPTRVMLDKRVIFNEDPKKNAARAEKVQEGYINPFLGAFVGHNPTIKQERPADWDKLDIKEVQKLNAGESFSLLPCKKAYTLAVKNFQTPTMLETKTAGNSFLDMLKGGKSGQRVDAAATSAHNLAELLRKAKLDAYVLHLRYVSIVCVGNFDSLEDPALKNMANLIETRVMPQISTLFPPTPGQAPVQARVVPMQVPR